MVKSSHLVLLVASVAAVAAAGAVPGKPALAQTDAGPVVGYETATGRVFKGVPYAASTGGENRFAAPKPPTAWTEARDATQFGPGCVQIHHNPDVPKQQSEDCLNMNIFAPLANATEAVPVMVFFHGGAFMEGSNRGPFGMYDGQKLQRLGVVVATVNYRLDALGFLTTRALEGNWGIKDQRFALQWVQRNIAAFGGDPGQVTIFGESAGAMSVGIHMVSPLSKGLFHAALMESNPAGYHYKTPGKASAIGRTFTESLGCKDDDVACLRGKNTSQVYKAMRKSVPTSIDIIVNLPHLLDAFLPWTPTAGTSDFPMQIVDAFEAGKFHRVPLVVGTNANEGATFIYSAVKYLPLPAYDLAVAALFGIQGADVLQQYKVSVVPPVNVSMDARVPLSTMLTDFWFRCASERLTGAVANAGLPAFVYRYDHVASFSAILAKFGLPDVCETEVCHASELPVVFGNAVDNVTFTAPEWKMSEAVQRYWTNFAKTGDPNAGGRPSDMFWPPYQAERRPNVVIGTPMRVEDVRVEEACPQLWDKLGYDW